MRKFMVTVNGVTYEVDVEEVAASQSVAPAAPVAPVAPVAKPAASAPAVAPAAAKPAPKAAPAAGGETIKSPMPGTILAINKKAGDTVKKGDVLCILEAMKMENEIMAPRDGKVAAVQVGKGSTVNPGDVLFVLA